MIYNTRNRSNDTTESQKEKRTCFNTHAGGVELVYMQYNVSDSQALFWCSALIILEMASLDTLCVNRHFGVNGLFTI